MTSKVLYFVGGVVVGSAATFFILKKRMEEEIDERVNDILEKERTSANNRKKVAKNMVDENNKRKEDLMAANKISSDNGYVSVTGKINGKDYTVTHTDEPVAYNLFSNPPKAIDIHNGIDEGEDLEVSYTEDYEEGVESESPSEGISDHPYVIHPEDFVNDRPFFDKITLEYYEDDVLCNAISEEIVTDIDRTIGRESLKHFGEYEEDVVYVRNDRTSTDYEVIYQHRPFAYIPGEGD